MARGSFYVTEKIGPKQSFTPEGFLLCEEVPIARTGMMLYGPNEIPIISPGPDGVIRIYREDEDIFNQSTIGSAQGKPVTNNHPESDVTPESWKDLTHGIMLNVRRGDGYMDDLLIGDLLITTPEGIKEIQSGKREVSLGYDADYDETAPGVGHQSNIIINHIALVEQGRCGPRCAIGDHKPTSPKGTTMTKASTGKSTGAGNKFLDTLMRAFKAKDAGEVEKIAEETKDELVSEGGATHIHVHTGGGDNADPDTSAPAAADPAARSTFTDEVLQQHVDKNEAEHAELRQRIEALEKLIATQAPAAAAPTGDDNEETEPEGMMDEIPEEMREEAKKTKDSAYFADSFKDTVALAEILAPGIRVPTFDGALSQVQTFKKICGLRRQALETAYSQPETRKVLDELLGGKPLNTASMTCDAARTLFRSAANVKRTLNNAASQHRSLDTSAKPAAKVGVKSLAELNRLNAERYKA